MKPLVIYHGKCADGFTAAWLANMRINFDNGGPIRPNDWVVDHHAAVYGELPPDVKGRKVYILDFSYPVAVLEQLLEEAEHITVIDHHATAIEPLLAFEHPRLSKHLSTERSGAWLASRFFWPEHDPMDMVKLVDDRDRWVFADKRTRPFHAALQSRPYQIGAWNTLSSTVAAAVAEGEAIERAKAKEIDELLDVCLQWKWFAVCDVPTANLPYTSASDAGAAMLARHASAPFSVTWFKRKDGKLVFSLRSRPGSDVDVGKIALALGGGGHKHAAGVALDAWPDGESSA